MKNCNCNTEINRDGSSQLQRYLKALDPSYAPIDGRSTEDLLVFAKRYAGQIRFYDIPESIINDSTPKAKISWREFFRRDMAVIAASISTTDSYFFKKEFDEVNERLQLNPKPEIYAALYAPIMGMLKKIDRWLTVAIPDNPLYVDLKLAIDSDLKNQVHRIISYEEGFKFVDPTVDLVIDLDNVENKEAWGLNDLVPPDSTIYTGNTAQEKILSASLFVEDIFHAFYNLLNKLIDDSEKYFHFAIEQYPAHQPHMALFITFLQLFRKAQEQMNGLTGRLLDFYYKEVLHLEAKPSVPDKAHIVFELAKDVLEYDIASGTRLKAGPDTSGVEQIYKTNSDLVINQAKVKELKTIFVEKVIKENSAAKEAIRSIYARPIANSADGFGEKFEGSDTKWHTFGVGNPVKTKPHNVCELIDRVKASLKRNDQARVGFSIASPQLLLLGGKRLVQIKLNASAAALFAKQEEMQSENVFEIWFTGEKEWFKIDTVMSSINQERFEKFFPVNTFNPATEDIGSSYYVKKEAGNTPALDTYSLLIYLSPAAEAVIEYNSKLHTAYSYSTAQPVMQVLLNPLLDIKSSDYNSLSVSNLSLKVKVGSVLPNETDFIIFQNNLKKEQRSITSEEFAAYRNFQADGLNKLVLQNETGLLPLGKPFDPFTAYPNTGKSFYVGSHEMFNKPLQQLAITIKKTIDSNNNVELPSDDGVQGLFSEPDGDFALSILEDKSWVALKTIFGVDFFQVTLKANVLNKLIPNNDIEGQDSTAPFIHPRLPIIPVTEWKTDTQKGFLRLTYIAQMNIGGTINSSVAANNKLASFLQVSQDLAPSLEIKEISVNYESDLTKLQLGVDEFYHVYPFGAIETYMASSRKQIDSVFQKADAEKNYLLVNANDLLLPQFTYLGPYEQYKTSAIKPHTNLYLRSEVNNVNLKRKKKGDDLASELIISASGLKDKISGGPNQYASLIQEEGMLFIGIENANPLQMISMLFQFAEGSAKDEDNDPPEIHWSYLSNNEWRPMLEENLVSDGTEGFQTTGIVKIELPSDATNNNTIITSGLYWLCASVTENSHRIPMLIDIVTQAVLAEFEDNGNAQSHFDIALPAGSINKLAVAASQVSKVQQPFASYDGKHKEVGKEFYARVSERLRHKQRAITPWDYEHLVLNRFPSIYKVKCITHTDPECLCREPELDAHRANPKMNDICCGPQVAPGHVFIVPISNLKNRNAVNPLQPKTSRRVLLDIESFLKQRTSPFVKVHAKNPVYEQVLVFFQVKFMKGFDKGFYMKKLNEEIVHYLTPWAFDENAEVKFGQKIYASSIINFIEERNYVDFITDFLMIVCRTGCCDFYVDEEIDTKEKGKNVLDTIKGCADLEILLQDSSDFIGDIIAKPSTARSLLVSAPKHIIIPYQEPATLTPCEKMRMKKVDGNVIVESGIEKANPNAVVDEFKPEKEKPIEEVNPAKENPEAVKLVIDEDNTGVKPAKEKPDLGLKPTKGEPAEEVKPPKEKPDLGLKPTKGEPVEEVKPAKEKPNLGLKPTKGEPVEEVKPAKEKPDSIVKPAKEESLTAKPVKGIATELGAFNPAKKAAGRLTKNITPRKK